MLSIVIVNYKSSEQSISLIQSILETDPLLPIEVVVVDNASKDGSADRIERHLPFSQIIRNETNEGYAKAVNKAFEQITGDHVLLINAATVLLTKQCLTKALAELKQLGEKAILGVHLVDAEKKHIRTVQADFPGIKGILKRNPESSIFKHIKNQIPFSERFKELIEAPLLKGHWLIFSSKLIARKENHFNVAFFQFGSDVEWCYRMQHKGVKFYYQPKLNAQLMGNNQNEPSIVREAQGICGEWLFIRIAKGKFYFWLYLLILKFRLSLDASHARLYKIRKGQLNELLYHRTRHRKLIRFGLSSYSRQILQDPDFFAVQPMNLYEQEQAIFNSLK